MRIFHKLLTISILILLFFNVSPAAGQTKNVSITVKSGAIIINEKEFRRDYELNITDIQNLLGAADRTSSGYNALYTYDKYGLVLFVDKDSGNINEIQLSPKLTDGYEFSPKSAFTGTFTIENQLIKPNYSLSKVQKKLKKYDFKKSMIDDNSYRGEYQQVYVYILFDKDNKNTLKFSIGLKK